ncbi:MAG: Ig-like domain-containing protein [Gemmatimonadaceae bacterium]|jgi:uncharacterized protein YjdB|nr:Ig-like domain-containing protein [Gemmatimonadaceae bacterium]
MRVIPGVPPRVIARGAALLVVVRLLTGCGGGGGGVVNTPTPPPPPPPPTVASVVVTPATGTLEVGSTLPLRASARDASGNELQRTFTWTSSNPSLASVSATGDVTAVAEGGPVVISATTDGRTGTAAITVTPPRVTAIAVALASAAITVGQSTQATATLRDARGNTVTGRTIAWTSSAPAVATVNATGSITAVAAGTTTIAASVDGTTGSAALTVAAADPCRVIRPITVGAQVTGALTTSDCRLSDSSFVQTYELTITTPSLLELEMSSSDFDAYLFLLDGAGSTVLTEDDDGGIGTNARILWSFAPGRYRIVANSFARNSVGAYLLSVRPAPAGCTPRAVPFPSTQSSELGTSACRLDDDSRAEFFDITLAARTSVVISMVSTRVDAVLGVIDQAGEVVAIDDDTGEGTNARIEGVLEPGRYIIAAAGYPGEQGPYTLELRAQVDPCAVSRTLTLGTPVNATLSATDCAIDANGPTPFTQRYRLTVPQTSPVQIDMTSGAVDSYLILQNADGTVRAENDDLDQTTRNARLFVNLPAGDYIVNASTFNFREVGPYQLLARASAPTPNVSVTVAPTALQLLPGASSQVTATVIGSTAGVTWSSTVPTVASVSATGQVRALTPGTTVIVAAAVADPSRTANVSVTVGTGGQNDVNLDIAALYLVQSVQRVNGSVPLIADRQAVARVFVRASRAAQPEVPVRLRVFNGTTLLTTLTATATPTLTVDEGCCAANFSLPAALIRSGHSVIADVDPANTVTELNEGDNSFPLNGQPQAMTIVRPPDLNIGLVPIRSARSGLQGQVSGSVLDATRSLWPLGTINTTVRPPLTLDYELGSDIDRWVQGVRDVERTRRTDGFVGYYYGLIRPSSQGQLLGLANGIPAQAAISLDEGSHPPDGGLPGPAAARATIAHELGHTFGLRHAPCGGAAGPDPNYPFPNAATGVFGMDTFGGNAIKRPTGTDIMSYCDNQWVSEYNYRRVLDLRAQTVLSITAAAPTNALVLSGAIANGTVTLDPGLTTRTTPTTSDPDGRYIAEGRALDGRVLFAQRFTPFRVDDARREQEAFVLAIPVGESVQAQVHEIVVRRVSGGAQASRSRLVSVSESAHDVTVTRSTSGGAVLAWSTVQHPMLVVRDRESGMTLAVARSGALDLSTFGPPDRLEVLLSDGVTSATYRVDAVAGGLRK